MGNNPSSKEDYQWYFRAEDNPFQKTANPKWSPYNIDDNKTIEEA
jgi:hypothetical protein